MKDRNKQKSQSSQSIKEKLYVIIFEADTRAGRAFDVALLWMILLSIVLIGLESLPTISQTQKDYIYFFEWIITVAFTLEYFTRIFIVRNKKNIF